MDEYHVYMLRCADGSYYVGVTNNWQQRLSEHQNGKDPESYTFNKRPVALVYLATFQSPWDAIQWEKKIKRWRREKKEALIRRKYERLPELSRNYLEKYFRHPSTSSG